ncbi:MAG TPA: Hsp20/alpha crystallin family protein [Gaiellaceae bacterium]|nr:Hsp20/alpha crystallin family protein [Gaiellaceae bacterium]
MTLMLREPFLTEPFRLMDHLFARWFGNGNVVRGWTPALDVRETADEYLVYVDLPGVKEQDVRIEYANQVLTISGTRVPVEVGEVQRAERPYGSFFRSLTLPEGIEADSIVAEYTDGVLTLHIPKPAGLQPKKIAITGVGQKAIAQ